MTLQATPSPSTLRATRMIVTSMVLGACFDNKALDILVETKWPFHRDVEVAAGSGRREKWSIFSISSSADCCKAIRPWSPVRDVTSFKISGAVNIKQCQPACQCTRAHRPEVTRSPTKHRNFNHCHRYTENFSSLIRANGNKTTAS